MKGINFGLCGFGQGGNNLVNEMAKEGGHTYAAINIADVDMVECKSIPPEHKMTVGGGEGAGQNITVGRDALLAKLPAVKSWFDTIFAGCSMPYLVGSFGGGFATLALPTMSAVLAESKVPHAVVLTVPRRNEDLIKQVNAKAGLLYFKELAEKSRNLKTYFIVDNQKLIETAKGYPGDGTLWEKANQLVSNRIQAAYRYTFLPSRMSIDPEDYKKVLYRRGACNVVETEVEISDITTENVLGAAFKSVLDNQVEDDFLFTGDLRKSEAVAVFIEREKPFEKEGEAIEILKETIRDETVAILRPVGVYGTSDQSEKRIKLLRKRPDRAESGASTMKITIVFAGLPFPDYVIDDITARIETEKESLEEARRGQESKSFIMPTSDWEFLEEVNVVSGVEETDYLMNSAVLGLSFEYADEHDIEKLPQI